MRENTLERPRGGVRRANVALNGLEWWRTEHVLAVYERLFGALEPQGRRRIIEAARRQGWDRTWDESAAA